jgi:hypothetical protein
MADQQQIDLLLNNAMSWNIWRLQQPAVRPDLSRANLMNADLKNTDLRGADLQKAYLRGTNLVSADLSKANLRNANLSYTDLSGANLRNANLMNADLFGTDLSNAILDKAILGWTFFGSVDLRTVRGLDTIQHLGPSEISTHALVRSHGRIPEAFLRGAGLDNDFIGYTHSLIRRPLEYYNCFISYAQKDQDFARRLYLDLQASGVRCWFAPEDMKTGSLIRDYLGTSMQLYGKLVLILSESSVTSPWIEFEITSALALEERGKVATLFPLRLDDAIFTISTDWLTYLKRSKHITDFSLWRRNDHYLKGLNRLLHDLDASAK